MVRVLAFLLMLLPCAALAQDDRGVLTAFLEDNLSGDGRKVTVTGFAGALSSRATVEDISIADANGVWLSLRGVVLDWNRAALFSGRVEVNTLTAREIELSRLPVSEGADAPSPEAAEFRLPDLPVSVQIGELAADRIILGAAVMGQPVEATLQGAMTLEGGAGNTRLALLRTDGVRGEITLDSTYSNITRVLTLGFALDEGADGVATTLLGLPGAPALRLVVAGDGPIDDYAADITLASDGQDRLAGRVTVKADAGGRGFKADLSGDVRPLLAPEYHAFFGSDVALLAEGRRAVSGALDLTALRLTAAELALRGRVRLAADGLPEMLDIDLDLSARDGTPVLLPVAGPPSRVGSARLRVEFDQADGAGWRTAGEVLGLAREDVTIDRLGLTGSGRISRGTAGAQVVGGSLRFAAEGLLPSDPALAMALGSQVSGQTKFDWRAGAPLRLSALELTGQGYVASGALRLDGLAVVGAISAQLVDLARLSGLAGRDLGGAGAVEWEGSVSPLGGAFDGVARIAGQDITVDVPELDGLLRGQSTIRLSAARGPDGTLIRSLDIAASSLTAQVRGWLRTGGSDLTADLAFADLAVMGNGYGGALRAQAVLAQADGVDRVQMTGTATDLTVGIPEVDGALRGAVALEATANRRAGIITLDQLTVNGDAVQATAKGSLSDAARDLSLGVSLPRLSALGPRYGGSLQADVTYASVNGTETITLGGQGRDLTLGQAEVDRVLRGQSRVLVGVTREKGAVRLDRLELDNPQLTARAQADGAPGRVRLTGRLADLTLVVPGIAGPVTLDGSVAEAADGFGLDVAIKGPGGIVAQTSGSVAGDFGAVNLRLAGAADTALANAFLGGVSLRGPVRFDLAVNGRPVLSSVSGRVTVSDTRVALADPPFALQAVAGAVDLGGGRAMLDLRAGLVTGGTLSVAGPVGLSAPFAGDLTVTLDGVVLRDPDLYETTASGQVTVNGPLAGGAMIAGRVRMSETELRIPSTGLGGTAAIPDLRHVNEPAAVRTTRARAGLLAVAGAPGRAVRPYGLDLTIDAPARVFVRGRGLDAELGGALRLTGSTANIIPSGGLDLIRGRLDLLGKRFAFTEGTLRMEGSFMPVIRLLAMTDTEDGQAGVLIDGPADAPVISFLSTPKLPQEEVVARLLFGRSLTSLTAFQAAQLASAVATLTGKGGAGVVDRLRRSFGLDDLDVSTDADGTAALRAGKYISDKIYADVTLGSEGKTDVSINLDVSKRVTVRGRASSDGSTGIGVYYEKDY